MLTIKSSFFYFAVKIATSYHNLQNDFCKIKDDGMHPRKLIQGLVFIFQLCIHYITHFKKKSIFKVLVKFSFQLWNYVAIKWNAFLHYTIANSKRTKKLNPVVTLWGWLVGESSPLLFICWGFVYNLSN